MIAALFVFSALRHSTIQPQRTPLYLQSSAPVEARIQDLLRRMTVAEKTRQLDMYSGTEFVSKKLDGTHTSFDAHVLPGVLTKQLGNLGAGSIHDLYPSPHIYNQIQHWVVDHNRLHIPALFLEEGVHGYLGFGETVFPCSINLAATFDTSLAKKTASEIATEARANGVDMLLGPVLDVAREPRWGRIEEDFGEDPYLTGQMGLNYVEGMQGQSLNTNHNVISEPKHFVGHGSPEGGLNTSPVHAGQREVRSIFLRSFQPAIERGHAMGVMAAYHEIDGIPCAGNPWLLKTVLRKEWGFKGFVLSDLGAINELYSRHHVASTPGDAVRMAIHDGVDMQFYDFSHEVFQNAIINGIKNHTLDMKSLNRAVGDVLRCKFELGLFDHPYVDESLRDRVTRTRDHLATSLQSSIESLCLLKNQNQTLPLPKSIGSLAIIGPNATTARLGDYSPSQGVHPINLVDAIKQIVSSQTRIESSDGSNISHAVSLAKSADAVILGLGERQGISGEGFDRSSLNLPDNQEALLEAVFATGKPVILVLENGRPLSLPWAKNNVPAILECFYPGEFGSIAIAKTLFGDSNPSGHLPISFPRTVGAIPDYYNHAPSKGDSYIDGSAKPLWPFGFGLSYTTFAFQNLKAIVEKGGQEPEVAVSVEITNTGNRAGNDVVQLYERKRTSSVETPVRSLCCFHRVSLLPGESKTIRFKLSRYELEIWGVSRKWSVESGLYNLWCGDSSNATLSTSFVLKKP